MLEKKQTVKEKGEHSQKRRNELCNNVSTKANMIRKSVIPLHPVKS